MNLPMNTNDSNIKSLKLGLALDETLKWFRTVTNFKGFRYWSTKDVDGVSLSKYLVMHLAMHFQLTINIIPAAYLAKRH